MATETGKLINGLALDVEDDEGEGVVRGDGEEEDDDADDIQKKTKKRVRGFERSGGIELIKLQWFADSRESNYARKVFRRIEGEKT